MNDASKAGFVSVISPCFATSPLLPEKRQVSFGLPLIVLVRRNRSCSLERARTKKDYQNENEQAACLQANDHEFEISSGCGFVGAGLSHRH
jgi:hypothetical protein